MPFLKKEHPFNSISSQHWKNLWRGTSCSSLLDKKQSFAENVNEFLQDQSKNLLNRQFYNTSKFHNTIVTIKILSISLKHLHHTLSFPRPRWSSKSLKNSFGIIGITESQLKVNSQPQINIGQYLKHSKRIRKRRNDSLKFFRFQLNGLKWS